MVRDALLRSAPHHEADRSRKDVDGRDKPGHDDFAGQSKRPMKEAGRTT
jgi:hypothetical protein